MAQHSIPAYEQDSISLPAGTHYRIRYKASPMERGLALHYHDHFEAFFAISDNIPYTVQGRQYTLETGNLLLIAPLALHQPCAQPGMCERIALRFAPSLPELLLGQDRELVSFLPGDQPARLLQPSPHIQKKLLWLLRGLLQEQAAKELGAALTAQALLTQVFVWCARAADCQQPPRAAADPSASLVQQVLEYMEHSYADRITLADLEQRFFINPPGGLSASPVPAAKTAAAGAPFAAAGRLAPAGGRPMRLWGLCEFLSSFPGSLRN